MPEPLKRRRLDGTLYVRPPEIEAWIQQMELATPEERARQFATASRKSTGYVPSEVLTHFMRRAWSTGSQAEFKQVYRFLLARIERSLKRVFAGMGDGQGLCSEIMSRFAERVAKDCKGQGTLLDFFEIHFDEAFAALRTTALRQIGPSTADTEPLGTYADAGPDGESGPLEVRHDVELAAAEFLGGDPKKINDPAFRSALFAAIDKLPADQRQVIGLLLQDFQIDSKDENVLTIARMLSCDERTVRNRRDRAYKALKIALEVENGS